MSNFHVMALLFKVWAALKGRIKILETAGEIKSPELLQTAQDWEVVRSDVWGVHWKFVHAFPWKEKYYSRPSLCIWISLLIPADPQFIPPSNWGRISGKKDNYIENRAGWIVKHSKRTPWDAVTLSHQASTPDTAYVGCKKAMTVAVEVFPDCLGRDDL